MNDRIKNAIASIAIVLLGISLMSADASEIPVHSDEESDFVTGSVRKGAVLLKTDRTNTALAYEGNHKAAMILFCQSRRYMDINTVVKIYDSHHLIYTDYGGFDNRTTADKVLVSDTDILADDDGLKIIYPLQASEGSSYVKITFQSGKIEIVNDIMNIIHQRWGDSFCHRIL